GERGERMGRNDIDSPGDRKSRSIGIDDKCADATCGNRSVRTDFGLAGSRKYAIELRDAAVGNPGLFPVEYIRVAIPARTTLNGSNVRPGSRFRESERRNGFAGCNTREVPFLDLRGAGQRDGTAAETLHGKGEVGERVVAGQRLANQREGTYIKGGARWRARGARCRIRH